jgi:hypothetical protein
MFFKPKPTPEPISQEEAYFASLAQDEIADAVDSLKKVIERGTCSKTLPTHIAAIARALEAEAQINHDLIGQYLAEQGEN